MSSDKITFLTNWQAVPYHLPVFRAQSQVSGCVRNIKAETRVD